ncbi:MAG: type II toxin-antitoxin system VapC family toxin [Chthoniobacterales bacterium]|nr:type II toxin-antitoxin system VapC family toxin [Chthoniobacterales bacterium]
MATKVIDSWALMALFNEEPAADAVEKLLHAATAGRHDLLMTVVNWGEIYYTALRRGGDASAKAIAADIAQMPITLVPIESSNLDFVRQAAVFKATKKLSYADCFAAALAKLRKAELVTGDKEFSAVERDIKINWLETSRA